MRSLVVAIGLLFVSVGSATHGAADGWLDDDPGAIWRRPPGFYHEGENWYAIIHVRPGVTSVRLAGDFTDWQDAAVELTRTPDSKFWWFKGTDSSFTRPPAAGDRYKFILDFAGDPQWFQDPAARRVENSALGSNSIVTKSSDFTWTDDDWNRPQWYRHLIYQVHPLRFTERNSAGGRTLSPLRQLTEEIDNDGDNDYLNQVGATTLQLLPVNEFAGDHSWGYNPSFFYAIESAYGSPDDLKRLVNTAHCNGVAVILDLVYNHGGTGDNILWEIAQNHLQSGTYYDGDTRWGAMVNFDNDIARHFFVQNIAFLAREYHIDGFRFDFTRPIHNQSDSNIKLKGSGGGWRFLREVREKAKAVDPGIIMIAEELPNTWYVTREDIASEFGGDRHGPFDSQWCDPFHDQFKAALTGNHLNSLYDVFTDFGDSWQDAVVYTESHDEVGNTDDRIARRGRDGKGWEMSQIAAAGTFFARGVPMIFMGQESGEWMQFGQDNDKLSSHNPGTGNTWWDDRLDLSDYESHGGRTKLRNWYRKMIDLRKQDDQTLAFSPIELVHIHDDNGVAAFTRDGGKYLVVMNFKGNSWQHYNVGRSGRYREVANTSWPAFNLGGYVERTRGGDHAHQIGDVPVPAYGVVVLRRE